MNSRRLMASPSKEGARYHTMRDQSAAVQQNGSSIGREWVITGKSRIEHTAAKNVTIPYYSITSSASDRRLSEILTPSAFAVLRLITNSNLVTCITGRLAGFSPLRMRPT